MRWQITLTNEATDQLKAVTDQRVQAKLIQSLQKLREDPDKQGKPLTDDLKGCRSIRAVGQRYRIIYQITPETVVVLVVTIGLRREGSKSDVYERASKLLRRLRAE